MRGAFYFICFLFVAIFSLPANAQKVAFQGVIGNKALIIVDNSAPRAIAVGQTYMGVKLISINNDRAVILSGEQEYVLRMGQSPFAVSSTSAKAIVAPDNTGHYHPSGFINGKPVKFMVDTGASVVAMGKSVADKLKIDYKKAQSGQVQTANGAAIVRVVNLQSVKVGDITVYNVRATIHDQEIGHILLGNSFLNKVNMKTENGNLVLIKK